MSTIIACRRCGESNAVLAYDGPASYSSAVGRCLSCGHVSADLGRRLHAGTDIARADRERAFGRRDARAYEPRVPRDEAAQRPELGDARVIDGSGTAQIVPSSGCFADVHDGREPNLEADDAGCVCPRGLMEEML